mgnify:CR=1 FL=1
MVPYGGKEKFMRKIIYIVITSLVFCNVGYAKATKAKILEKYEIKIKPMHTEVIIIACVDGYKFIHTGGIERNLIQFFEERDGKSLPAKC